LLFQWRSLRHECEDPSILLRSIKRPVPPPTPAPDVAIREALLTPNERLKLILRLAAEPGLRSAEITSISSADIQPASDGWEILTVHGKGQKNRVLPVPPDLMFEISRQVKGQKWLFPGNFHGHLSSRWVGKLAARNLPDNWTLQTLRHCFATTAYTESQDIIAIQ
jgi:putative tyrosine recombinase